jgi:hypothetical protein
MNYQHVIALIVIPYHELPACYYTHRNPIPSITSMLLHNAIPYHQLPACYCTQRNTIHNIDQQVTVQPATYPINLNLNLHSDPIPWITSMLLHSTQSHTMNYQHVITLIAIPYHELPTCYCTQRNPIPWITSMLLHSSQSHTINYQHVIALIAVPYHELPACYCTHRNPIPWITSMLLHSS